jgi:hypothetical protein
VSRRDCTGAITPFPRYFGRRNSQTPAADGLGVA